LCYSRTPKQRSLLFSWGENQSSSPPSPPAGSRPPFNQLGLASHSLELSNSHEPYTSLETIKTRCAPLLSPNSREISIFDIRCLTYFDIKFASLSKYDTGRANSFKTEDFNSFSQFGDFLFTFFLLGTRTTRFAPDPNRLDANRSVHASLLSRVLLLPSLYLSSSSLVLMPGVTTAPPPVETSEVARDGDEVHAAIALVEWHDASVLVVALQPSILSRRSSTSTDRTTSFVGTYTNAFRLAATSCIIPFQNSTRKRNCLGGQKPPR